MIFKLVTQIDSTMACKLSGVEKGKYNVSSNFYMFWLTRRKGTRTLHVPQMYHFPTINSTTPLEPKEKTKSISQINDVIIKYI